MINRIDDDPCDGAVTEENLAIWLRLSSAA
jgi:hypothetical protein